ncbi:MAG: vitamin B12 dependent-methionine synthase activation domain-containing protein [Eubacteriales bacterium]|nr:vitamin B12 dependent-methionine synthase activation domain-containing protein [Eubacteriales bacterium]
MKIERVSFDFDKASPLAEKRFISTCGFDLSTTKHKKMMEMGLDVREKGKDGIKINAIIAPFDGNIFKDHKIVIDGKEIFCNFFEQIPDCSVKGIYFYMLTAGECFFSSEENIMDFLYADIWGTNYVDAGIELLKEKLQEDLKTRFSVEEGKENYLSDEFGPGYFGMPVIETKKFNEILDGSQIGVKVKESGLIIPQKSCSGLYLVLNDRNIKFEKDCLKCNGTVSGCQFCKIKKQKEEMEG